MKFTLVFIIAAFTGSTFARLYKRDECATACTEAYNSCRVEPNGSQALCAEKYESCLGFNPFMGGNAATAPTACSKGATGALSAYQTSMTSTRSTASSSLSTSITTSTPAKSAEPTSDNAESAAAADTTTPMASADTNIPETYDCVTECNEDYNTCRTAPNANMATCAAKYASCLGYNPFSGGGSFVTPTACSVPTSAMAQPTQTSSSSQSVIASQSEPPQQDTTFEQATTVQQPMATCGGDMCMDGTMTDDQASPTATETPVAVDAAGNIRPLIALAILGVAVAL